MTLIKDLKFLDFFRVFQNFKLEDFQVVIQAKFISLNQVISELSSFLFAYTSLNDQTSK